MPDLDSHAKNRVSWNAATRQHNSHKGDQAAFLRDGGTTLFPEEIELLGDIRGKTLVHLQCNSGQDTLSIANHLGADVTGVDISDEAVTFAQQLSADSEIPGQFVRADVFDWFAQNSTQYDILFSSYGAIGWLSDLVSWGAGVAAALKPGGRFVLVEFHPALGMVDYDDPTRIIYDYGGGKREEFDDGVGDYVAMSGSGLTQDGSDASTRQAWINSNPSVEFMWGIGDVTMALTNAGLRLTRVQEYMYSNGYRPLKNMREEPGRRMYMPDDLPRLPLMFSIVAEKPDV